MLSKSAARAFFLGGTVLCAVAFVGLTVDTLGRIPAQTHQGEITDAVRRGKDLWDRSNCMGCHTLLGEGAYFAPELGNVYKRRGPDFIKAWIKAQPTGAPGRRQMPNFHFTDAQLDDMVEFLKWTNGVNTENWPPNIEG